MSFKAKLFMGGEERTILNASQIYHRFADVNGRPTSKSIGAPLEFTIESTHHDSFFYENMFSPTMKCEGEIVFYRRDGFSTMFKIEFANAQIIGLSEYFNAVNKQPLSLSLVIGWGIMRIRGIIYEQPWNPNNPFLKGAAPTVINQEEPEVIKSYFKNTEGNELDKLIESKAILYVETENMVGEKISIDLSNKKFDFLYQGEQIENDLLENIIVKSDKMNIELEVIKQKMS